MIDAWALLTNALQSLSILFLQLTH